jgi:hypothetical protein
MALLTAAMMISTATAVPAAESMKHDMQKDLHEKMGMGVNEEKQAQPAQKSTTVPYMKHDMQRDLHVNLGMGANDPKESVTKFESPTDPNVYKP